MGHTFEDTEIAVGQEDFRVPLPSAMPITLKPIQAGGTSSHVGNFVDKLAKKTAAGNKGEEGTDHPATTVMLRNLPYDFSRDDLLDLLDSEGFLKRHDFVYLPIHLGLMFHFGYAFVNPISEEDATRFHAHFQNFSQWKCPCTKVAAVSWADSAHGLEERVRRFRNSPIMHPAVPDAMKPCIFKDGQRVPFPPPTRQLRCPRVRKTARLSV